MPDYSNPEQTKSHRQASSATGGKREHLPAAVKEGGTFNPQCWQRQGRQKDANPASQQPQPA